MFSNRNISELHARQKWIKHKAYGLISAVVLCGFISISSVSASEITTDTDASVITVTAPTSVDDTGSTPNVDGTTASTPNVDGTTASTPKDDETTASTPNVDGTTASTPKDDETTASTPNVDGTTASTPKDDETTVSTPNVDGTTVSTPDVDETTVSTPKDDETTVSTPKDDETTVSTPKDDETTVSTPKDDETTVSTPKDDETTVSTPKDDETTVSTPKDDETTVSTPKDDETTVSTPKDDETTVSTPKDDETTVSDTINKYIYFDTIDTLPVAPDTLDESEVGSVTYQDASDYAKTVNAARLSKFELADIDRKKIASNIFTITETANLSEKESQIVDDLKQNFDKLPTPVRNMIRSINIDRVDNNNYGWTYSILGNVYINAKYFEKTDSKFQTSVMLHEIGHAVDGQSYFIDPENQNSVDKSAYSFSRDKQVQSLLKTAYPNSIYYEAFASLFGSYASRLIGVSSVETPTDTRIDTYFDELLRGVTYPTSAPDELYDAINSAKIRGLKPIYQGKEVFAADNDTVKEYRELVTAKNASTTEFLNSGGTSRQSRSISSTASTLLPYSVAMLDTSKVVEIAPLNLEATTDGYDMTVTNISNPDLVIRGTNQYNKTDSINRINISTTEPATLSANSKLVVKYSSNDPITALVIDGGSLTDGVTSSNVTAVTGEGNVKFKAEVPIGELSSGVIKSYTSNFAFKGVSRGQTITATYELWDGDKLLESRSQNYTVNLPDSDMYIIKDTSTEYRVKFNDSKEVTSSKNLDVGFNFRAPQYKSTVNHLSYDVKVKIPEGMSVTPTSLTNGWVERDGYLYRTFKSTDMNQDSAFVTNNNLTNVAGITNPNYTNAQTYGLSFDVSKFGTYDELVAGKQYTLNMDVTAKDEMGSTQVYNLTDTGYIRTLEIGQGEGVQFGYTGVQIEQNEYQGKPKQSNSVYYPTTVQNTDRVGITKEDYDAGKQSTIRDIKIYFDKTNVIDDYSVKIVGFRTSGRQSASLDLSNATFDILDINTQEKISSITVSKNRLGNAAITLPNNIDGIILRPTGSLTTFGSDTTESFRIDTTFTPNSKDQILSDFKANDNTPIVNVHELSYGELVLTNQNVFEGKNLVVSTFETPYVHAKHLSNAQTSFGKQRISYSLAQEGDSQPVDRNVMSLFDEANRVIVMTIPSELTLVGQNGKTYSGGTFRIPVSDFRALWNANELTGHVQLEFELKPTNASVGDGQYDLSWYIDWSSEPSDIQEMLIGKDPIAGNQETTKNSMTYTISNQMMLGTQARVANESGAFVTEKNDVVQGTPFILKTTLINTIGQTQTGGEAIQYLPRTGDSLGSTYDVTLTGPVTMPTGWKVVYTTDSVSGDRNADSLLNYTDTVTDYSKVTAVKYIQTGNFTDKTYSSITLPVKTDSELTVDSVAYSQVGIKTNQYPSFVESNPVRMSPKVYTESWIVDGDVRTPLQDSTRSITPPTETTDFTKDGYTYVGSETDVNGNVIHKYVQLGTIKDNTILIKADGSRETLSDWYSQELPFGSSVDTRPRNIPESKTITESLDDRTVTKVYTYAIESYDKILDGGDVESVPYNSTEENLDLNYRLSGLNNSSTVITYYVRESVKETVVMKQGAVTEKTVMSTGEELSSNTQTLDYGTEYSTSAKNVPETKVETIDESDRVITRTTTYTVTTPENSSGTVSSENVNVTYIVTPNVEETFVMKQGTVTEKTVMSTGEELNSNTQTLDYGTEYSTTAKNVPDTKVETIDESDRVITRTTTYTVTTPENSSGTVSGENVDVTYIVTPNVEETFVMKQGTVTEKTVMSTGEELSSNTTTSDYGAEYSTTAKNVPETKVETIDESDRVITRTTTYTVSTPENATGTVSGENVDVTYVVTPNVEETFVMKQGTVTEKTVDNNGNILSSNTQTLDYGTEYSTSAKNVPDTKVETIDQSDRVITRTTTYTVSTPENSTGTVSSENIDVTYVVTPNVEETFVMKQGTVTEKTVMSTGEELSSNTTTSDYGAEYSTSAKNVPDTKVETIDESDRVITRTTTYTVSTPENATGTVSSENVDVTYVVTPNVEETFVMKQGTVTEKTVMSTGEELNSNTQTLDYGTEYSTTAKNVPDTKVETIDESDRVVTRTTTYTVSTPENAAGTVSSENVDVTYVVTPNVEETFVMKQGTVTEKTVMSTGEELSSNTTTSDYGTEYTTSAKNVPDTKVETIDQSDRVITRTTTYAVSTPENATGTVSSENVDVTYVVTPNVEETFVMKQGTVTEKTVDNNGNILSSTTTTSDYGTEYSTSAKNVPETKVETIDESDRVITRTTTYTVTAPENATGTVSGENVDVTYVVKPNVEETFVMKQGAVTEKTVMSTGEELSSNTTTSDYGTEYSTSAKNVPDTKVETIDESDRVITRTTTYTVTAPENATGTVSGENVDVTYVVKPNVEETFVMKQGTVTEKTVMNTGEELSSNTTTSDYGTEYSTSAKNVPETKVDTIDESDRVITRTTTYTVSTPENATGTVSGENVDVTYVVTPNVEETFVMKQGTIIQKTVLSNGDTLSDSEMIQQNYGTEYSTSAKNVPETKVETIDQSDRVITRTTTYTVSTPENATGTVSGENVDVIYVVTPKVEETFVMKQGTVTEKTIDNNGNILSSNTQTLDYGTEYSTTAKNVPETKVETIDQSDRVITRTTTYTVSTPENATGTVSNDNIDIIYVITPHVEDTFVMKQGTVTEKTVMNTGEELSSNIQTLDYGTEYSTSAKNVPETKVETIDQSDRVITRTTTYTVSTPENATGTVSSENVDVTYVVTPNVEETFVMKQGAVTEKTVDNNGNILSSNTQTLDYGTKYSTSAKNVPDTKVETIDESDRVITRTTTYTVTAPENAAGTVSGENVDVTYVVTPNVEETFVMKQGTVTETTVDNDGNIISSNTQTSDYGTEYTTSAKNVPDTKVETIEGSDRVITRTTTYTVSTPENATGTVSNDNIDVTYVVTPNVEETFVMKQGTVTEKTVDNDGNILSSNTQTLDYGTEYNTSAKNVPETKVETIDQSDRVITRTTTYTVSTPENATGTVSGENVDVTYVVTPNVEETFVMKQGTVTEKTVDNDGDIISSNTQTLDYGTEYSTSAKNVPETSTPDNASGSVSEENIMVTSVVTPVISDSVVMKSVVDTSDSDTPSADKGESVSIGTLVPAKNTVDNATDKVLPNTGESTSFLSLLGLGLLTVGFGFNMKRKKR